MANGEQAAGYTVGEMAESYRDGWLKGRADALEAAAQYFDSIARGYTDAGISVAAVDAQVVAATLRRRAAAPSSASDQIPSEVL